MGTVSQVSEHLGTKENLSKELKEMRIMLATKDGEIVHLKMHNQKVSSEGPSGTKELAVENKKL